MKEDDIKKLLFASRTDRYQVDPNMVPGWDYAHLSRVVAYCYDSGFIRAAEATTMQSPHREFVVQGISARGEDWLEEHSPLKKIEARARLGGKAIAGVCGVVVGAIGVVAGAVTIWQNDKARAFILSLLSHQRH